MNFLLVAALAAAAVPATNAPARLSEAVLVRAVIDGDTIDVSPFGRVRLLGIDAPEIGRVFDTPAPFAREARERLIRLVLHRWVRLQQDLEATDVYNRRLAYVVLEDGMFVNAQLVRDGLARVSARLPLARLAELKGAEAEAQTFRRGMWGGSPAIASAQSTSRVAPPAAGRYTASSGGSPSRPPAGRSRAAVRRAPPPSSTDAQPTIRQRTPRRSTRVSRPARAGKSAAASDSAGRRDTPRRHRRRAASQ